MRETLNQKDGIRDYEIAAEIRRKYPKHDTVAYSIAKHPELSGVMLTPGAVEIRRAFLTARGEVQPEEPAAKKPKADRHRRQHRVSCRLPKSVYEACEAYIAKAGVYRTKNDWLESIILDWLEKEKAAAVGAAAAGTNEENVLGNITGYSITKEEQNVK